MNKKESLSDMISRRLKTEFRGLYTKLSYATGESAGNISRMSRQQNSPSLRSAEVLIDFFADYDASWKGKKPLAATPDAFINERIAARCAPVQKTPAVRGKSKK